MGVQMSGGKGPINLNLTALIDISALIVIFLIMGTIFGQSSLDIPPGLELPLSIHNDSISAAPEVKVNGNQIEVPFLGKNFSFEDFEDEKKGAIEQAAREYLAKRPPSSQNSNAMLNFIAHKNLTYARVFKILKPFRAAGFETVLFVARGK